VIEDLFKNTKDHMEKTINNLRLEFGKIRTGRATPSLLDSIKVEYYGQPTPLKKIASVSAPEGRLLVVTPWDPKSIPDIEKAILKSELGLVPSKDTKMIRIPIPPLTEERRSELVKFTKKIAEDIKVTVRQIRRDAIEGIKKLEKEKSITEDELKKGQDRAQKLTDEYIKKIDEVMAAKEKEIMEV
jgi:ribosome recycling factor